MWKESHVVMNPQRIIIWLNFSELYSIFQVIFFIVRPTNVLLWFILTAVILSAVFQLKSLNPTVHYLPNIKQQTPNIDSN